MVFDGQLFPHDQNRFHFRLKLLSFFAEPLIRYRTELVGHDTEPGDWSRALGAGSERSARRPLPLPRLGPRRGRQRGRPHELAFSIRPAPWQTPWAMLSALLLLLVLAITLFRARTRAHARREADLEEQVAARTRRLQRANALLIELSYVDALTSVPNRRRFDELFAQEWQRSLRSRAPLALVIFDIDEFKRFNDRLGHQEGDEALRQVATALADGLTRSGDTIARYGGEEFAAILPATDTAGAARLAEQFRARVEALADPPGRLGVAPDAHGELRRGVDGGDARAGASDLFRRADEAMYRAKRAGGNQTALDRAG